MSHWKWRLWATLGYVWNPPGPRGGAGASSGLGTMNAHSEKRTDASGEAPATCFTATATSSSRKGEAGFPTQLSSRAGTGGKAVRTGGQGRARRAGGGWWQN